MKKKKNEKRIRKGEKPSHIELQQAYIIVMTGWISGFSHVELLAQWLSALQTFFHFVFFIAAFVWVIEWYANVYVCSIYGSLIDV